MKKFLSGLLPAYLRVILCRFMCAWLLCPERRAASDCLRREGRQNGIGPVQEQKLRFPRSLLLHGNEAPYRARAFFLRRDPITNIELDVRGTAWTASNHHPIRTAGETIPDRGAEASKAAKRRTVYHHSAPGTGQIIMSQFLKNHCLKRRPSNIRKMSYTLYHHPYSGSARS